MIKHAGGADLFRRRTRFPFILFATAEICIFNTRPLAQGELLRRIQTNHVPADCKFTTLCGERECALTHTHTRSLSLSSRPFIMSANKMARLQMRAPRILIKMRPKTFCDHLLAGETRLATRARGQ